jgi:hypothetical protein
VNHLRLSGGVPDSSGSSQPDDEKEDALGRSAANMIRPTFEAAYSFNGMRGAAGLL